MGIWIDRLAGLLLDATLAAGVLLSLAALAMVACRQPVRRCGIARAAILGSIALLPMVWLKPVPRINVVGEFHRIAPPIDVRLDAPLLSGGGASPAGRGRAAWPGLARWTPRALTIFYVATVGANLAWMLLGWWGVGWLARHSGEPSHGAIALYDSIRPDPRRPRLRVAARARRPVLFGIVRPLILIPPELDLPETREQLRLSLLHELGHAERLDVWFGLAGGLAQAFWFFQPPLWWLRAQMRLDQEFLADRRASSGFGPLRDYAASLVDMADPASSAPPVGSAASPARESDLGGSPLFLRVLMLVRCPFPVELASPIWWRVALLPAVVIVTVLASALTLRGPSAWANLSPRAARAGIEHGVYALARLNIEDPPVGPDGRPKPFPLLIKTPRYFDLTLEIWADSAAALANLRIVGQSLIPSGRAGERPDFQAGFHPVRLRRGPDGFIVWVDGRQLPPSRDPTPVPEWITVQATTRQFIRLRDLKLTW